MGTVHGGSGRHRGYAARRFRQGTQGRQRGMSPDPGINTGPNPGVVTTPGRDGRLGDLAIIGLVVLGLFAALFWMLGSQGIAEPPEQWGSSLSAGPKGALALYTWLQQSGFEVSRVQGGEAFPPQADTLVIINPSGSFPKGQTGSLRDWVERGGTLIFANEGDHALLDELGFSTRYSGSYTNTVPMSQPLFANPAVARVKVPAAEGLQVPVSNTVVLASSKDESGERVALAAMVKIGVGRAFLLSSDYPLTNEGIQQESNGAFIYNMAQLAGGRRVAFDEVHHGQSVGGDLLGLMTSTSWGWALIYGVGTLAIYTVWSARRLGPPLPVPTPDRRRPTSDYVKSVAGLFRRARKPGYAAECYLRYFKGTLSRYAELDPYLTDEQFVRSLGERGRHVFNQEAMVRSIEKLRGLEGNTVGGEATEVETLKAIRAAENSRREALGIAQEQDS
ncbi:MAG: DUF4350 domain-containing protein [Chloroflexota bacterium]|nr:DUF4350 domain-containing protein [Chloroflexota bacterium]